MDGEIITVNKSSESIKAVDTVSVLVVDDDTICLSIVAAILKKFQYEVVTVKHPIDALCTLRIKEGAFDLVVSDVHMPDMNGFELQQAIAQEFNLPVILMSADDQEDVVLRGLESGAAYFILKPIFPDDLKDLWQFASINKKKNRVVIEESTEAKNMNNNSGETMAVVSASSVNEDNNRDLKRKSPVEDEKRGENSQKKPKVVWTNALHNRFLEALRSIGLDRAVPKKILEVMNVPGITRENVASHLQKYRIFLRKVSDAGFKVQNAPAKSLTSSTSYKSNFTLSSADTTSPSFLKFNTTFSTLQNQKSSQLFPNQGTGSSTLISSSGFGQSRLLSNRANLLKPNTDTTNLKNQGYNHRAFVGFTQNGYQSNDVPFQFQGQGNLSRVSVENLSKVSLENLSKKSLENLSKGFDAADSVNATNGMNWSNGYELNNGITPNPSQSTHKYVGYQLSDLQQLIGPGSSGHVMKKYDCLESSDGNVNLLTVVNAAAPMLSTTNDSCTTNVDPLAQELRDSSASLSPYFAPDDVNAGREDLSDVIAECYRALEPSNVENGDEIHEFNFDDMTFDLAEFNIFMQPLEESDPNNNSVFADQVNVQNQAQQMGGENIVTSSGLFGGTINWNNQVPPSFDQPPNQSDDDFLDSLLARSPFGDDFTIEGI